MKRKAFQAALPYTLPIFIGFLFIGLSYGFLMTSKGFSVFYPIAMSIVIYAGAMQFVADEGGNTVDIGALVRAGQIIARVGDTPVHATIDGVLRGLIREGYPVTKGLKIADIDPRPEQAAYCDTVSDKARAIGGGVVEALLELAQKKHIRLL